MSKERVRMKFKSIQIKYIINVVKFKLTEILRKNPRRKSPGTGKAQFIRCDTDSHEIVCEDLNGESPVQITLIGFPDLRSKYVNNFHSQARNCMRLIEINQDPMIMITMITMVTIVILKNR